MNKNTEKEKEIIHKKLMKELTWSQNTSINNSGIPKSNTKFNKRIKSKRSNSKQYYNEQETNNKKNSANKTQIRPKSNTKEKEKNKNKTLKNYKILIPIKYNFQSKNPDINILSIKKHPQKIKAKKGNRFI